MAGVQLGDILVLRILNMANNLVFPAVSAGWVISEGIFLPKEKAMPWLDMFRSGALMVR